MNSRKHYRKKRRWAILRTYCLGWTLAFVFLSIVRGVGTIEEGSLQFSLWFNLTVSFIMGPLFGAISGYSQLYMEERIYKRTSLQKFILWRTVYVLLFISFLIVAAYFIYQVYFGITIDLIQFAFEPGSFAIYIYVLAVDLFMLVLRQVNLMLGNGNLRRLLMGKFYTPREEERIFMFLDLQSSTQLAEQLGHISYSTFIQDCFNDLGVVAENEAEIYQYVGDEVILTWKMQEGLRNGNCINAYFNFLEKLKKKETHYRNKYGYMPFFKAGINAGIVTVTEVGRYKKEIAFHGDTINTAARIQAKCNEFDQGILISEYLKNKLSNHDFSFPELGSIQLKGKEKGVAIYAVERNLPME